MKTIRSTLWPLLVAATLAGCVSTERVRTVDADAARYNTQLAHAYLQRGDADLAVEKIDRALEQDRNYAEAHLVKGMILARAEDFGNADRHYMRAARLAPENTSVLSNVAVYLCERGRHKDGEAMFLDVSRMTTYNRPAIALTNAGLCAKRIPALERAEAHFRRALDFEPNYAPALRQLAEVKHEQGEYLAARAFLQRLEGVQRLGPDGLMLGANIERGMRDPAAERRYVDILMRDFPESDQARKLSEDPGGASHGR